LKIWGIIEDRYKIPTKYEGDKVLPKPNSKWDDGDFNKVNINSKAISCIINGLTGNEFFEVMKITCAQKM